MPENQVADPFAEQEAVRLRRQVITRERVLTRLWELANLSPEITRYSITGQIKALSMIVSLEGLTPDRAAKPSDPPSPKPNIYRASWLPGQKDEATAAQQEEPAAPDAAPAAAATPSGPGPAPSESNPAHPYAPAKTNPWVPEASAFASIPDQRVDFSAPRSPFGRRR
jgi:hypothetical protein